MERTRSAFAGPQGPYNYTEGWFYCEVAHHEAGNVNDIASRLAGLSLMGKLLHVTSNHFSMSLCDCCLKPAHLRVSCGDQSSTYLHLAMFQFHKYIYSPSQCSLIGLPHFSSQSPLTLALYRNICSSILLGHLNP